jgi:hypothetical protein
MWALASSTARERVSNRVRALSTSSVVAAPYPLLDENWPSHWTQLWIQSIAGIDKQPFGGTDDPISKGRTDFSHSIHLAFSQERRMLGPITVRSSV